MKIKICAVSDLHEQWNKVEIPKCDILVNAGDLTYRGDLRQIESFNDWCKELKELGVVKEVVTIAGNHDLSAQKLPRNFKEKVKDFIYLQDSEVSLFGIRIYGSPWSPSFYREYGWVFNADRGFEMKNHLKKIPEGLDILLSHSPPFGLRDKVPSGEYVGCKDLLQAIKDKKPKYVVCGHIHHSYGQSEIENTIVINASICTEQYKPDNKPIIFEIEK